MIFELEFTNGTKMCADKVLSYEWLADMDAACDGLRLTFLHGAALGEIYRVYVYEGQARLFCGYADLQKVTEDAQGQVCFVYARSSACLLLDNEAQPISLVQPNSRQLFACFAEAFGFANALPAVSGEGLYLVQKGTTCFGAIHNFMLDYYGKGIYVDPQNVLCAYESGRKITVPRDKVLSAVRITERGAPVSTYYYKIESGELYRHCLQSRALEPAGVVRRRYVNLSAYPAGQREQLLKRKMYAQAKNYNRLELTVEGEWYAPLCAGLRPLKPQTEEEGYLLYAREIMCTSDGVQTRLRFRKEPDLQEVAYVAQ